MSKKRQKRRKILIVDDSEMNRSILVDILGEEYDIIEAVDGTEAVALLQKLDTGIDLVLLDIVMPNMDGFEVLAMMNKYHWIDDIPVIMISSEIAPSVVERAYELGVTDFINRPFDELIVHRRVNNTIVLYAKQKKLIGMVVDQIFEKQKSNDLMVSILSHIVEFRNGESGLHVLHIHTITEILLENLIKKTDQYHLKRSDIDLIGTASALHDIGKIAIPSRIINKPGILTKEEFEVMKTHSKIGAQMLEEIPFHQDEELIKVAYQICRWHHERYDGKGYPDGLKGDEIPISAQVVSLADVYDALTNERVYKAAFSHEGAMKMIVNGECGTFNPLLLECFLEMADEIQKELQTNSLNRDSKKNMKKVAEELVRHDELTASERTLHLLEYERTKYKFFASMSNEIQFEYNRFPEMITISEWGVEALGLSEITMEPTNNKKFLNILGVDNLANIKAKVDKATYEKPVFQYDCQLNIDGNKRWSRIICQVMWSVEEEEYTDLIGKVVDVQEEKTYIDDLQRKASYDALTGLLNQAQAKKRVLDLLKDNKDKEYAFVIFDLDYFKNANDNYGHIFGNHVLEYIGQKLTGTIRSSDIAARIGGDEFMVFLEANGNIEPAVERIFLAITGSFEQFKISISMGIAKTKDVGRDYNELFAKADEALYMAKRTGRSKICFFNEAKEED